MLQLVGIIVTAAITLATATTINWPTLRRRIREHASLLKDLPPKAAEPLVELLQREVKELVQRDGLAIDPVMGPIARATKYAFFTAFAISGGSLTASVGLAIAGKEELANRIIAGTLPFAIVAVAVAIYFALRFRKVSRKHIAEMEAELRESRAGLQRRADEGLAMLDEAERRGEVTPDQAREARMKLHEIMKDMPALPPSRLSGRSRLRRRQSRHVS